MRKYRLKKVFDDVGEKDLNINNYDISYPDWGPYSKKFAGISHIANPDKGYLMDFAVCFGFASGKRIVPVANKNCDYFHWEADKNLNYYSYRYELEWKDITYADIRFHAVDENTRLLEAEIVNNTDQDRLFDIEAACSLAPDKTKAIKPHLLTDEMWIDGAGYSRLVSAEKNFDDGLPCGIIRNDNFINGLVCGGGWARGGLWANEGDEVTYSVKLDRNYRNACLYLRYAHISKTSPVYQLKINGEVRYTFTLNYAPDWSEDDLAYYLFELGPLSRGEIEIAIRTRKNPRKVVPHLLVDGFILRDGRSDPYNPRRYRVRQNINRLDFQKETHSLTLTPSFLKEGKYILYSEEASRIKLILQDNLEEANNLLSLAPLCTEWGLQGVKYLNLALENILCKGNSHRSVYLVLAYGNSEKEILRRAMQVYRKRSIIAERNYKRFKKTWYHIDHPKFGFSQERLMAQTLTNISYPVQIKGRHVKYYLPGKFWNSLYLWDMGFQSLGLVEHSSRLAVDCLNQYLVPAGSDEPFISHGSMVPVQIYALWEIYQRTGKKELLKTFYPSIRTFYRFIAGTDSRSSFAKFGKDGLLNSYDYFYSSAGMDDLPPQVYVHENNLEDSVSPPITTSFAVRAAKMLSLMALALGIKQDILEYRRDIERFEKALLEKSWNEETGWFSYYDHKRKEKLYYGPGVDYNMTFDGISPLISGTGSRQQTQRMFKRLKNPRSLWTPYGLSAIDQSAPYYHTRGYWIGRIFAPYQWFFWKVALQLGELDWARKLMLVNLNTLANEVNRTYCIWETVFIKTGQGAGWGKFSGLVSPMLIFYNALFQPGRISAGYDTWVHNRQSNEKTGSISFTVSSPFNPGKTGVMVATGKKGKYRMETDEENQIINSTPEGTLLLAFNLNEKPTKVSIERLSNNK